MPAPPRVSVVVPVFNEEESLPVLYREVVEALAGVEGGWELVLVDDGSSDGTRQIARQLAGDDPRVVAVLLRRNFGQTAAMQAGLDHARGDVIVTMDGDLQNDPADIPRFLEKLDGDLDVVCGWRRNRMDDLVLRKIPSRAANRLLRTVTGVDIHDTGCSLKAYRASVIRRARLYADMHRFIPAIASLSGARVGELVVHHRPRTFGETKYGISRTWKVLADLWVIKMILDFITRPGVWFASLGLPWLALSVAATIGSAMIYARAEPTDEPQLVMPAIVALSVFAFFHVILVGVIGELVLRTGDFRERENIETRALE